MIRAALLCMIATPVMAHDPTVEAATVSRSGETWSFSVTLSHPDTGWDHYADGWEILTVDGTRLGYRELLHPHVTEQPFTRSLSGVAIPADVREVLVRPRCSVHGWAGESFRLSLP